MIAELPAVGPPAGDLVRWLGRRGIDTSECVAPLSSRPLKALKLEVLGRIENLITALELSLALKDG